MALEGLNEEAQHALGDVIQQLNDAYKLAAAGELNEGPSQQSLKAIDEVVRGGV